MSIVGNYAGDLQAPITLLLTNTDPTVIGATAENRSLFIASVIFANDTASAVQCKLYRYSEATTTDDLIWTRSVPANDTEVIENAPIRLEIGDSIKVKGDNGVSATIILLTNFALNRA